MFKKKFSSWGSRFRARSGTRKLPARVIPKSIARVRTDWVTVFNVTDQAPTGTGCKYLLAPWVPVNIDGFGEQCFSSFSFPVISADNLSDLYGDDVKIVKMVGDFWLRPVFTPADACFPDDLALLQAQWDNYFVRARGGLFKQRVVSSDLNANGVVPHPLFGRDWSDAGFLKLWERNWVAPPAQSVATTYGEGQLINAIGNVTRDQYNTPATSSGDQPLFSVPAIETECMNCVVGSESCYDGPSYTRYMGPGWKRVSISSRRMIHMKEDDALAWWIDWADIGPSGEGPNCGYSVHTSKPCGMQIIPSLKIKLQYG